MAVHFRPKDLQVNDLKLNNTYEKKIICELTIERVINKYITNTST